MLCIPDLKADLEGLARRTPLGLRDHGRISVDPDDDPLRPNEPGEAQDLVPKAAPHVQNVMSVANRTKLEHTALELLGQGISIDLVQPSERGLDIDRLPASLKSLMQAFHDTRLLQITLRPNAAPARIACGAAKIYTRRRFSISANSIKKMSGPLFARRANML